MIDEYFGKRIYGPFIGKYNTTMKIHFLIYGLLGLLMEVIWTGFWSLFSGNFALTGHTYIWMFFIYGLAVFLEPIHERIRRWNFVFRGFTWAILIFSIEFITGYILQLFLSECPWDYRQSTTLTFMGLIRYDYFPAWFAVGFLLKNYTTFSIILS
ncbi:putative ABC transporter permease [Tepidibacillus marianensis]|uniref:putative ABC transporter permease n=1 Tax=Tepidibacillus marianensis TaxID=3131995 RepID=UPI0030CB6FD2